MKTNSANPNPCGLQLLTVGFCKDLAGEQKLIAAGVEPFMIWRVGDGNASSLEAALAVFRNRGGCLAITDDLRIFGDSRKAILAMASKLTRASIKVVDVTQHEMDVFQLADQACGKLHAAAPIPNRRIARRRGSWGGKAKAAAAALARAVICSPGVARRLCARKELTWEVKAFILGIPVSTAQRHYGATA